MKKMYKVIYSTFIFNGKFSISRVFLFILFINSVILWNFGNEIPQNMMTIFVSLLAYLTGGKIINNTNCKKEKTTEE